MPVGSDGIWEHDPVEQIAETAGGVKNERVVTLRCQNCGQTWPETL